MGKNQEFVCSNCGIVTDTPRGTVECPRMHGGPHSWSAIPKSYEESNVSYSSITMETLGYSNTLALLGAIIFSIITYIFYQNIPDKCPEAIVYAILLGWIIGGFIKPILKIGLFLAFIILTFYLLDKFKIIDLSGKPEKQTDKKSQITK